jgi:DNA polymerase iota
MSSAEYYEDLSRASSSEESDDEESLCDEEEPVNDDVDDSNITDNRCILHVDVDCFYCQCEMIDRNISSERPIAIGQKHIIVTCNYAARNYGVKKLELRDQAYKKCPSLLILEGSDLERYRIHARNVYLSFRTACQRIHPSVSVAKGAMDEMSADLSVACFQNSYHSAAPSSSKTASSASVPLSHDMDNFSPYVYGEQSFGKEKVTLTEDQTGDSVVVVNNHPDILSDHQISSGVGSSEQCSLYRNNVHRNLQQAACFARQVQRAILDETGFTVTCGISVNPLLSKWAGDLRKPNSINILYPPCWERASSAQHLISGMPLRKIPGVGHATLKALEPCLERRHSSSHGRVQQQQHQQQPQQKRRIWTCQ